MFARHKQTLMWSDTGSGEGKQNHKGRVDEMCGSMSTRVHTQIHTHTSCGYLRWHLSVPPCWLSPVSWENTLTSFYLPLHLSVHPAIQMSLGPGIVQEWLLNDAMRDWGKKEGCKDALVVMLHVNVHNTCNNVHMCSQHTHITSSVTQEGGGCSSLTQVVWGWIDKILNCQCCFVGPHDINRLLQLLGAADEVRLLMGSCEQGSNDGTKVRTIVCQSYDVAVAKDLNFSVVLLLFSLHLYVTHVLRVWWNTKNLINEIIIGAILQMFSSRDWMWLGEGGGVHNCFFSSGMMLGGGCGRELAHWIIHGRPDKDMYGYDIRYIKAYKYINVMISANYHRKFQTSGATNMTRMF